MTLPNDILALAETGLIRMQEHPSHHYDWRIRRDLYQLMKRRYRRKGRNAQAWLAVIAAEYVLPIFTQTFPDDPLPQQLLTYASQIAERVLRPTSSTVRELLDEGYLATGIDCITWRSKVAYNAEYAGEAAYKALLEAEGKFDLLASTEDLLYGRTAQASPLENNLSPDLATDYHIAHLASYSDTASSAAIAYSCEVDRYTLEPQRLKAFWEWWAGTAIREAWYRAQ